jgi:hypothetical protein
VLRLFVNMELLTVSAFHSQLANITQKNQYHTRTRCLLIDPHFSQSSCLRCTCSLGPFVTSPPTLSALEAIGDRAGRGGHESTSSLTPSEAEQGALPSCFCAPTVHRRI